MGIVDKPVQHGIRDGWIKDAGCYGKTPMQTFLDTLPLVKEKLMAD